MALPALATPEELAVYTQQEMPVESAELALRLASGKVRGYINRPDLELLTDHTTAPDDIKSVVLAIASRMMSNPANLRQETVGSISLTYATETVGAQLTELDRADLRRYRINARSLRLC